MGFFIWMCVASGVICFKLFLAWLANWYFFLFDLMHCYNHSHCFEERKKFTAVNLFTQLKRLNRKSVAFTENGVLSRQKRKFDLEC